MPVTADLFGSSAEREDAPADNRLRTSLNEAFDAVPEDWRDLTEPFRRSAVGQTLIQRVDASQQAGDTIYPGDVFAALRLTRRDQVRVVILGQDPYHGPNQAHGLAFSVLPGVKVPPSLRNIYKEIQRDLQVAPPQSGNLEAWARQGVLLLNTSLTVAEAQAGSHAAWGWEVLTDAIIAAVAEDPGAKVFMLWGAHAQRKRALIAAHAHRHELLLSNHPSPLSASRGPVPFIGNGHFRAAQAFWARQGQALDWRLG